MWYVWEVQQMIGILILTLVAFVFSIILVNIDKNVDNIKEIKDKLPGYNCGACGCGTCEGLATMINENPEMYKKCRILKGEKLEELKKYLEEEYNLDKN